MDLMLRSPKVEALIRRLISSKRGCRQVPVGASDMTVRVVWVNGVDGAEFDMLDA